MKRTLLSFTVALILVITSLITAFPALAVGKTVYNKYSKKDLLCPCQSLYGYQK